MKRGSNHLSPPQRKGQEMNQSGWDVRQRIVFYMSIEYAELVARREEEGSKNDPVVPRLWENEMKR